MGFLVFFFNFYREPNFEQMEWVGKIVAQQKMRTRTTPNLIQPHRSANEKVEGQRGEDLGQIYTPVLTSVRTSNEATSYLDNVMYFCNNSLHDHMSGTLLI